MNRIAFGGLVAATTFVLVITSASARDLTAEPGREGEGGSGDAM